MLKMQLELARRDMRQLVGVSTVVHAGYVIPLGWLFALSCQGGREA